jgi:hypothetical protein
MIVTRKHIPRRTILRGLGTALALPLLDSMVPAFGSLKAATPVKRFGVFYVPMGRAYSMVKGIDHWTPAGEGPFTQLSPILTPLEPVKDRALLLTGLSVHPADFPDQGPHPRMQTAWLTGIRPKATEGADIHAGISMDQVLAREIGQETQIDSLQIGIESADTLGNCAPQYSCTYTNTISWRTPTSPLPMEISPRAIFERLFGTSESTDAAARVTAVRDQKSILDSVNSELSKFRTRVAPVDRPKIEQYTDAIRDIERRLQKAEAQSAKELPVIDQPSAVPGSYGEHVKLMQDLIVIAYQADLSRVFSFLMAREGTYRAYPEIGVPDSHHPISHHGDREENLNKLVKINTYHVQLFTHLVQKLAATPEGNGTLLDGTVLLYGSGIGDPNAHLPINLPTLVVAGSKIDLQTGRHLRYPKEAKMSELQLLLIDRLGAKMDRFGDADQMLHV